MNYETVLCGQGSSLLWTPAVSLAETSRYRPNAPAQEKRGTGRYVRCMRSLCMVEEGTVGVSSLASIFNRAPSRHRLLSG